MTYESGMSRLTNARLSSMVLALHSDQGSMSVSFELRKLG